MDKHISHTNTHPFLSIMILFIFLFSSNLMSNNKIAQDSVITVPLEIDLKLLENHLNNIVPNLLADIHDTDRVCVESKYLRTKGIPKCRMDGYKISCKDRWIKIQTIPQIKCDIKGWVKRDGPIRVSGKDQTLKFAFPVKAKVSTEAGIRETALASATLYMYATPHINKDWSVSVNLVPHFVWSEEPTITLLKVININIKDKVEARLHKKMRSLVKKVPKLLADIGLKEKVHTAWNNIQEPMKIHKDSETYLLFKPTQASYSGFTIVDNIVRTTISTRGSTEIIIGKPYYHLKKTALCDLGSLTCKDSDFNFHLPVSITYEELLNISDKKNLETYSIHILKTAMPGVMTISKPRIEKNTTGGIRISAHINYDNRSAWLKKIDLFNWFDIDGEITFNGLPRIDQEKRALILDNLIYDSTTNSDLFDILVDATELEPLKSYFSNLLHYKFGEKLDEHIVKANQAFKNFEKDNMQLSAYLKVASIDEITLNENHITITTKLSGKIDAKMRL